MPPGEKVQPGCEPRNPAVPVAEFDFVLMHEVGHAEDDGQKFMDSRTGKDGTPGDKTFGAWSSESPKSIARVAAAHFGYDQDYIYDTLDDKGNEPPKRKPEGTRRRRGRVGAPPRRRADLVPHDPLEGEPVAERRDRQADRDRHARLPGGVQRRPLVQLRARRALARHHGIPVPCAGRMVRRAVRSAFREQAQARAPGDEVVVTLQATR